MILGGYEGSDNYDSLEKVISIYGNKFIALAFQTKGICIYEYQDQSSLEMVLHIGPEQIADEGGLE